jgi:hypothetical protein
MTKATQNLKEKNKFWKMLGNAILLASIQASIGSVEMSSKFSVVNFSKDQETLQGAADALTGYLLIAFVWTIGSAMISYGQYSWAGLFTSLVANIVLVGWIYFSYLHSFNVAKIKYGLKFPKVWPLHWSLGLDSRVTPNEVDCNSQSQQPPYIIAMATDT